MRRQFQLVVLLCAVGIQTPAVAKEFSYPNVDCKCTIPDKWVYRNKSGYLLDVVNMDRTKGFFIKIYPINLGDRPVDSFENYMQKYMFENGYVLASKTWTKLDGVDFYQVNLSKDMGNKVLYDTSYFAAIDGQVYMLNASEYNSMPTDDDELKAMVASFTFLTPPQATPRDAAPKAKGDEVD